MQNPKKVAGPWLYGGMFSCALIGAVALAAYAGRPAPRAQLASLDGKDGAANSLLPGQQGSNTAPPALAGGSAKTPTKVVFEKSFEAAMERARAEKKPILIDFYADWCVACKAFDRDVLPRQDVIQESANWVKVRVNGDKRPDVASAYGITGYPAFVFAQGNGIPVAIVRGYDLDMDFADTMRNALVKWKQSTL